MSKIPGISVCFVIKNGIVNGYPFWESLESCLPIADEIVISEGYSMDSTMEALQKFQRLHPGKVKIFNSDWKKFSTSCGEVIASVSMEAIRQCSRQWVYYLQADELIHKDNYEFIRNISSGKLGNYNSVNFPFAHFIGSWDPLPIGGAAYSYAIRMVRNIPGITLVGDAWTFGGSISPTFDGKSVPKAVYHFGWVFPKNINQKNIEHAKLYPHMGAYQQKAKESMEAILAGKIEQKGLPMPTTFTDFPENMKRLIGCFEYTLPPGLL